MSFVAVVTDSTASIDEAYLTEHNVTMIPLYIHVGDKTYRDVVDIQPDEFYEMLPKSESLPTTSQPSVGDFVELFQGLVAKGAEAIISVHISSGLSGTINSARLASEQMGDIKVGILDSLNAVAAHMLTVEAVVNTLESGGTFEEAMASGQAVIDTQKTIFVVDTLEYLYKGGRIGGAAALFGSVLQFKPLLHFVEGRIDAWGRVRTFKRALTRMIADITEWVGSEEPMVAVIMEAANPESAQTVVEKLPYSLKIAETRTIPLSPVIGTHAGPGTIGLCCCPAKLLNKPE